MAKNKVTADGKKELGIFIGVIVIAVVVFAGFQLITASMADGGFSNKAPEITYKQLQDKINNNEDFILIYGSETCSACKAYKPVYASVVEEFDKKIPSYYVDINTLKADDATALGEQLGATDTPTTYMFIDGIVQDQVVGVVEKDVLNEFIELFIDESK